MPWLRRHLETQTTHKNATQRKIAISGDVESKRQRHTCIFDACTQRTAAACTTRSATSKSPSHITDGSGGASPNSSSQKKASFAVFVAEFSEYFSEISGTCSAASPPSARPKTRPSCSQSCQESSSRPRWMCLIATWSPETVKSSARGSVCSENELVVCSSAARVRRDRSCHFVMLAAL